MHRGLQMTGSSQNAQGFPLKCPTLKPTLLCSTLSAFSHPEMLDLAWPPKREWCFVLASVSDVSASTRLPCLAHINIHWQLIVKFKAALHGFLCDSRAFLFSFCKAFIRYLLLSVNYIFDDIIYYVIRWSIMSKIMKLCLNLLKLCLE